MTKMVGMGYSQKYMKCFDIGFKNVLKYVVSLRLTTSCFPYISTLSVPRKPQILQSFAIL